MKQYLPLIAFVSPFILFFFIASQIHYEQPADLAAGPTLAAVDDASAPNASAEAEGHASAEAEGPHTMVVMPGRYFTMIATRVVVIGIVIAMFWRLYTKTFPLQIDRWGIIVGVVGAVLWIGACNLRLETSLLSLFGLAEDFLGARDGVNPFELYPESDRFNLFIVFRFALLVITVPIAEELFLRGFFMRFFDAVAWEELPLNRISLNGLLIGTAYGVLSHPSEFIAAALWFSLVTWLMVKTNKFWNCVVAHAITNLILGIYVLNTGSWHLW